MCFKENKMILLEKQMDLFSVDSSYYLAHCISGDFALGAGIAVKFNDIYSMRDKLLRIYPSKCEENVCVLIDRVFNLITKKKCWGKPTLYSLKESLLSMKSITTHNDIKKVAMPKIGCGLDRLTWKDVKLVIEDVFNDTDLEILVCYL
jgi:hypothetical protein